MSSARKKKNSSSSKSKMLCDEIAASVSASAQPMGSSHSTKIDNQSSANNSGTAKRLTANKSITSNDFRNNAAFIGRATAMSEKEPVADQTDYLKDIAKLMPFLMSQIKVDDPVKEAIKAAPTSEESANHKKNHHKTSDQFIKEKADMLSFLNKLSSSSLSLPSSRSSLAEINREPLPNPVTLAKPSTNSGVPANKQAKAEAYLRATQEMFRKVKVSNAAAKQPAKKKSTPLNLKTSNAGSNGINTKSNKVPTKTSKSGKKSASTLAETAPAAVTAIDSAKSLIDAAVAVAAKPSEAEVAALIESKLSEKLTQTGSPVFVGSDFKTALREAVAAKAFQVFDSTLDALIAASQLAPPPPPEQPPLQTLSDEPSTISAASAVSERDDSHLFSEPCRSFLANISKYRIAANESESVVDKNFPSASLSTKSHSIVANDSSDKPPLENISLLQLQIDANKAIAISEVASKLSNSVNGLQSTNQKVSSPEQTANVTTTSSVLSAPSSSVVFLAPVSSSPSLAKTTKSPDKQKSAKKVLKLKKSAEVTAAELPTSAFSSAAFSFSNDSKPTFNSTNKASSKECPTPPTEFNFSALYSSPLNVSNSNPPDSSSIANSNIQKVIDENINKEESKSSTEPVKATKKVVQTDRSVERKTSASTSTKTSTLTTTSTSSFSLPAVAIPIHKGNSLISMGKYPYNSMSHSARLKEAKLSKVTKTNSDLVGALQSFVTPKTTKKQLSKLLGDTNPVLPEVCKSSQEQQQQQLAQQQIAALNNQAPPPPPRPYRPPIEQLDYYVPQVQQASVEWPNDQELALGLVLGYLDYKNLFTFRRVCRHWRSTIERFLRSRRSVKLFDWDLPDVLYSSSSGDPIFCDELLMSNSAANKLSGLLPDPTRVGATLVRYLPGIISVHVQCAYKWQATVLLTVLTGGGNSGNSSKNGNPGSWGPTLDRLAIHGLPKNKALEGKLLATIFRHEKLPLLRSLAIYGLEDNRISPVQLPARLPVLAHLEKFYLEGYAGDLTPILTQLGPPIRHLLIDCEFDHPNLCVSAWAKFLKSNPEVGRRLVFLDISVIPDNKRALWELLCSTFTEVQKFQAGFLFGLSLDETLPSLRLMHRLQELYFNVDLVKGPYPGLAQLEPFTEVRILFLGAVANPNFDIATFRATIGRFFPNLEELRLATFSPTTVELLKAVIKRTFPRLKSLQIGLANRGTMEVGVQHQQYAE